MVDNQLTGVAISMGAGMCNIAVMYQGMTALSFSVSRGGDWIDECVATDTGRINKGNKHKGEFKEFRFKKEYDKRHI